MENTLTIVLNKNPNIYKFLLNQYPQKNIIFFNESPSYSSLYKLCLKLKEQKQFNNFEVILENEDLNFSSIKKLLKEIKPFFDKKQKIINIYEINIPKNYLNNFKEEINDDDSYMTIQSSNKQEKKGYVIILTRLNIPTSDDTNLLRNIIKTAFNLKQIYFQKKILLFLHNRGLKNPLPYQVRKILMVGKAGSRYNKSNTDPEITIADNFSGFFGAGDENRIPEFFNENEIDIIYPLSPGDFEKDFKGIIDTRLQIYETEEKEKEKEKQNQLTLIIKNVGTIDKEIYEALTGIKIKKFGSDKEISLLDIFYIYYNKNEKKGNLEKENVENFFVNDPNNENSPYTIEVKEGEDRKTKILKFFAFLKFLLFESGLFGDNIKNENDLLINNNDNIKSYYDSIKKSIKNENNSHYYNNLLKLKEKLNNLKLKTYVSEYAFTFSNFLEILGVLSLSNTTQQTQQAQQNVRLKNSLSTSFSTLAPENMLKIVNPIKNDKDDEKKEKNVLKEYIYKDLFLIKFKEENNQQETIQTQQPTQTQTTTQTTTQQVAPDQKKAEIDIEGQKNIKPVFTLVNIKNSQESLQSQNEQVLIEKLKNLADFSSYSLNNDPDYDTKMENIIKLCREIIKDANIKNPKFYFLKPETEKKYQTLNSQYNDYVNQIKGLDEIFKKLKSASKSKAKEEIKKDVESLLNKIGLSSTEKNKTKTTGIAAFNQAEPNTTLTFYEKSVLELIKYFNEKLSSTHKIRYKYVITLIVILKELEGQQAKTFIGNQNILKTLKNIWDNYALEGDKALIDEIKSALGLDQLKVLFDTWVSGIFKNVTKLIPKIAFIGSEKEITKSRKMIKDFIDNFLPESSGLNLFAIVMHPQFKNLLDLIYTDKLTFVVETQKYNERIEKELETMEQNKQKIEKEISNSINIIEKETGLKINKNDSITDKETNNETNNKETNKEGEKIERIKKEVKNIASEVKESLKFKLNKLKLKEKIYLKRKLKIYKY